MDVSHNAPEELLEMLVVDGVLTRANAEVLRERLRDAWVPLGKVLRQRGKLTMGQLLELLQKQSGEPHVVLGQMSVTHGYCTQGDVEDALRIQREISPHVLDMLLSEKSCDLEKLVRSLARYVRALEVRVQAMSGAHQAL